MLYCLEQFPPSQTQLEEKVMQGWCMAVDAMLEMVTEKSKEQRWKERKMPSGIHEVREKMLDLGLDFADLMNEVIRCQQTLPTWMQVPLLAFLSWWKVNAEAGQGRTWNAARHLAFESHVYRGVQKTPTVLKPNPHPRGVGPFAGKRERSAKNALMETASGSHRETSIRYLGLSDWEKVRSENDELKRFGFQFSHRFSLDLMSCSECSCHIQEFSAESPLRQHGPQALGHFGKKLSENHRKPSRIARVVSPECPRLKSFPMELVLLGRASCPRWSKGSTDYCQYCLTSPCLNWVPFWSRHGWVSDARHGESWCMEQVLHIKKCHKPRQLAVVHHSQSWPFLDWLCMHTAGSRSSAGRRLECGKEMGPTGKGLERDRMSPHLV